MSLQPSRRQLLGFAATGAAAGFAGLPDVARAARPVVQPTTYGVAVLTAAMRGATRVGSKIYQTTRAMVAPDRLRIVEADLESGKVTWTHDVEVTGSGGLMMAGDGSYAYIGMAGNPTVLRLDPATHQITEWVTAGPDGAWFYDMAIAGEWLYLSTYPDCTVRRVHLASKEVQTYGVVSTSKYANSLAVNDTHVYGGANAPGGIREWPLDGAGTEGRDITSYLGEDRTIPIKMVFSAGHLFVGIGKSVVSFDPVDGSAQVVRPLLDELDRYIDYMCVASDQTVYAIARTSGNIYRCDAEELVKVGQALEGDGQNNFLGEYQPGVLCGTGDSGRFWTMRLGEEPVVHDIVDDAGYPDKAQDMIRHSSGTIWVSGHGATTVHDLSAGTSTRVQNFGEIKALTETADGIVYGAVYPGCTIARFDTDTLDHTTVAELEGQYRPSLMDWDEPRNQLVVVSGPPTGGNQGAVSFVDLSDHSVEVRTDILPDQSVRGLHLVGDVAYVCGDTYGEAADPVIDGPAQIAAVDLTTGEVLWRAAPRADVASYERIVWRAGKVYLMTRRPRGDLFSYDPQTEAATHVGNLGGYGGMAVTGRRLMTWVHWQLEISHVTAGDSIRPLFTDVPNGWFNNPTFVFDPEDDGTWGMYGDELAWFPFRA